MGTEVGKVAIDFAAIDYLTEGTRLILTLYADY